MKKLLISVISIFGLLLTGCTVENTTSIEVTSQVETSVESTEISTTTENTTIQAVDLPTTDFNKLNNAVSYDLSASNWTTDIGPYVELNGNVPYFTEYTSEVFENYSELDSLGRPDAFAGAAGDGCGIQQNLRPDQGQDARPQLVPDEEEPQADFRRDQQGGWQSLQVQRKACAFRGTPLQPGGSGLLL